MQKLILSVILLTSFGISGMKLDKRASSHIIQLRQKYPTLSPIMNANAADGTIVAYYEPKSGKTRALVALNNGTYERPYICQEKELEVFNALELDKQGYEGFLDAWEKHVTRGLFIKLPLSLNATH